MLGERIKTLKTVKGWTTQQLAEASGLPADTINKIISGATKNPNFDTLRRLAAALDTTVDKLMEGITAVDEKKDSLVEMYERRLAEAQARELRMMRSADIRFFVMLATVLALVAWIVAGA